MISITDVRRVLGSNAYDSAHNELGRIGQVFVDDQTGEPEWMTVRTGMHGDQESFVPLQPAQVRGDEVIVPFEKRQVKDAPRVEPDTRGHISEQDEVRLYEYYRMQVPSVPMPERTREAVGPEAGGMIRSEERMHVGRETRESGRARLRKFVVTEDEQHTVPLHRDTVRVVHEPISEQERERMAAGAEISEAEQEVVLQEERPMVAKETVPMERVRLVKETQTGDETVRGQVRKEQIEATGVPEERATGMPKEKRK